MNGSLFSKTIIQNNQIIISFYLQNSSLWLSYSNAYNISVNIELFNITAN